MNISVTLKDGCQMVGRFFSKSEFTLSIELDKNEGNDSIVSKMIAGNTDISDFGKYWFLIFSRTDIEKIEVL